MASHGGTISIEAKELARTLVSGPIGGVVGGPRSRRGSSSNVLCTDIGGTSFDIALLTDGRSRSPRRRTSRASCWHAAGQDRLDRRRHRVVRARQPELGAARARAGLGRLADRGLLARGGAGHGLGHRPQPGAGAVNPDYFLGGDIQLDPERAHAEVERQVAKPLGLGVEDAAAGVISLFEQTLRNEAVGRILGKGYSPADYSLLCYGGGGPLHVAGYTEGVPYRDVLVPAWAAGFSAYGCACAEFEYRYDQTIDMPIGAGGARWTRWRRRASE